MSVRTSVYLPDETVKRAKPYRDRLNYSELLRLAVEAEIDRLEAEAREAAQRDVPLFFTQWYENSPLTAMALLERAEGEIPPPPEVYREIIDRGREYGPVYVEEAFGQWTAGTVSTWQRSKSGYQGGPADPYMSPPKSNES